VARAFRPPQVGIVRGEAAPRLMAVNIDEGEPDLQGSGYLEQDPHRFLEGMLIASWAVGIAGIYIYLRDDITAARLARSRAGQASGQSAGAAAENRIAPRCGRYICGEESAMIESIEGKRACRACGRRMWRKSACSEPDTEHNFETLYWVRELLERGARGLPRRAAMAARACGAFRFPAA